jgi:hypothetical protein
MEYLQLKKTQTTVHPFDIVVTSLIPLFLVYTVFIDFRGKKYSLPTPHRKYYYILIPV